MIDAVLPGPASSPRRHAAAAEVYIIDDDEAFRRVLSRLLRGADFLVRTYGSAREFLREAARLPPGCIIADLRMPGMDGLELLRRVAAAGLPFRTIMMTGNADVGVAVDAMKEGATDFIEKPFDCDALVATVRRTLDGLARAGHEDGALDRFREAITRITPRERDVLRGVMAGKTNKVIARDLEISPRTVELHRAHLMSKVAVDTVSELVRLYLLAHERRQSPPGEWAFLGRPALA